MSNKTKLVKLLDDHYTLMKSEADLRKSIEILKDESGTEISIHTLQTELFKVKERIKFLESLDIEVIPETKPAFILIDESLPCGTK